MTFVVTEACINCKHSNCVEVCPADAFHEGSNFVVINPDECIDCALCVSECPVDAIFADDELPPSQTDFLQINRDYSRYWPILIEKKDALEEAGLWSNRSDKRQFLEVPPEAWRRTSS